MYAEDSGFLNTLGLGNFDIGYIFLIMMILIIVLLILVILLFVKSSKLKKRLNQLTVGNDGRSLEQNIMNLFEDNKILKANADKNKKDMRILTKKLEAAYQKMGLVKYDAFNKMGGQLSFSLCLLDDNNNGFILNSVHSTEGCYSYTKEIKAGESAIELGEEEAEALSIALGE